MAGVGTWALSDVLDGGTRDERPTVGATVTRVDEHGTAWLSTGGGPEFPAAWTTASVKPGDMVTVAIGGGRAEITGNATDPPAPTTRVDGVQMQAERAGADAARAADAAKAAKTNADEAQSVAQATSQHFWTDDNGAHVADEERADWDAEYDSEGHGSLPDPSEDRPWHNILMNSFGILLRRGLLNLVGVTKSAVSFFDGSGNEPENIVASFGKEGVQIGIETGPHVIMDENGLVAYDGEGSMATVNASNIEADHLRLENMESYIHAEVVDGTPTLTLSAGDAAAQVRTVLTNSRLAFTYGDDDAPVAYIGEEDGKGKLFVENAVVVSELELGQWVWTPMKNGNLALKWVGSTEQEA